jgi:hypothetical protein
MPRQSPFPHIAVVARYLQIFNNPLSDKLRRARRLSPPPFYPLAAAAPSSGLAQTKWNLVSGFREAVKKKLPLPFDKARDERLNA